MVVLKDIKNKSDDPSKKKGQICKNKNDPVDRIFQRTRKKYLGFVRKEKKKKDCVFDERIEK